jgi:hypothetical protein
MLRLVVTLSIILVFVFGFNTRAQEVKKTKVLIFAGQSNMDGKGDGLLLSESELNDLKIAGKKVEFIFDSSLGRIKDNPTTRIRGKLQLTDPLPQHKEKYRITKSFGPELFLGIKLNKLYPNQDFLFIKRSQGHTSLHGSWNPEWSIKKAAIFGEENYPKLYYELIDLIDSKVSTLKKDSYEITGVFWVQGEKDSGIKNYGDIPSKNYYKNLKNLVSNLRAHLNSENLPFFILQVGSGEVVQSMKRLSKEDKNVYFTPQEFNPKSKYFYPKYKHEWNGNPVGHYNYEGMKKIGIRFFESYINATLIE